MKVNKGDKIFKFSIELKGNGIIQKDLKAYEVLGSKESDLYEELIVLDDDSYTTLQTKEEKYRMHSLYGKAICYEMKWNCSSLIDYITGQLYTNNPNEKVAYKSIKKAMNKFINDKYGKYGNYINLLEKIEI